MDSCSGTVEDNFDKLLTRATSYDKREGETELSLKETPTPRKSSLRFKNFLKCQEHY